MFSLKISASQLQAIRETEGMMRLVAETEEVDWRSILNDATVSGEILGVFYRNKLRTLRVSGSILPRYQRINKSVKSVIELVKEGKSWFPVSGNLLYDGEHYTFDYRGVNTIMIRSYVNLFPSALSA